MFLKNVIVEISSPVAVWRFPKMVVSTPYDANDLIFHDSKADLSLLNLDTTSFWQFRFLNINVQRSPHPSFNRFFEKKNKKQKKHLFLKTRKT